jgi:hypothetical protein
MKQAEKGKPEKGLVISQKSLAHLSPGSLRILKKYSRESLGITPGQVAGMYPQHFTRLFSNGWGNLRMNIEC